MIPTLQVAQLELANRTVVVEASAGTGKTHNIAEIVVRALAEGFCTVDQVMLVTFTVKATAELRSRVHARLVTALTAARSGQLPADDVIFATLDRDRAGTTARLEAATADFDSATILTHHGFSQRMLSHLGILVDHDATTASVAPLDDLIREIAEDVHLRSSHDAVGEIPDFSRTLKLVREGLLHGSLPLARVEDARQDLRQDQVHEARREFEHRKRVRQVYSYDDMSGRLHEALTTSPLRGAVKDALSQRYRLVMVDEFQDTDVQQWEILREAFEGRALLVLIGDPKQAIYGFRGADVHAYLMAAQDHPRFSLQRNWRSGAPVLAGIDAILNSSALGEGIATNPSQGAAVGLTGDQPVPAVELRLMAAPTDTWTAMDEISVDLANHVVELLGGGVRVPLPARTSAGDTHDERLRASHIAVLCRTSHHMARACAALQKAGVPAVPAGEASVLTGDSAKDWQVLLDTLLDVRSETIRRASLTGLIGWDLHRLVAARPGDLDELAQEIRSLSQLWRTRGIAVMMDALYSRFNLHERLLSTDGGADRLSELLQVGEALSAHELATRSRPEGTRRWLREAERRSESSSRRLGNDRDAVRVLTMHGAKGLGFPVVLIPDLWFVTNPEAKPDKWTPRVVHQPGGRPELDVRPVAERTAEESAEALRLAYVAMTRARYGLRLWWANTSRTGLSPLHRLLTHDDPGTAPAPGAEFSASGVDAFISSLDRPRFASLSIVRIDDRPEPARHPWEQREQEWVAARAWTRTIDRTWRRTSYTGLTADLHELSPELRMSPEPGMDEPLVVEDPDSGAAGPPPAPGDVGEMMPSPMAGIPGGAEFGSLVHAILEHVDPQAADLHQAIEDAAEPYLRGFGPEVDREQLVTALELVFDTPLGALTGGTLRDLPARDRLPELDFEMTMGSAQGRSTVADLASLFSDRNLLPAGDPLAHYGEVLADTPAADQVLHGFLNGSIDAVLRIPDGDDHRHVVVDYKTNTLPVEAGQVLSVQDYSGPAMTRAMVLAHYPLQALVYSVALHRFLAWRLPGYNPDRHLGGVGYLFVRGMAGPRTPEIGGMPAGVFTWMPPTAFILAADAVLAGARPTSGEGAAR